MNAQAKIFLGAALAFGLLLLVSASAYTVDETEQVVITQFGRPVGEAVTEPGLHWKTPFIQQVNRFDKRYLEWDGDANELTTKDKRFIEVDVFARWRISDPLKFFQRLRDQAGAQTRLDDILDGETRNSIANHELVEVVRTSNREPLKDESLPADEQSTLKEIASGRESIRQEILEKARERAEASDLGIEILDLQLKRVNYVQDVRNKVYDRMKAERQRIATRYRSEGDGEAARIKGTMEEEVQVIKSGAYRDARETIGEADAEAARIFAEAYDASPDTRAFYEFLKTMETLSSTIDGDSTLILSTDGEFFRYLEDSTPSKPAVEQD